MRKKPYSLWKRKLPSGASVYYIRFRLEDDSWGTAKSSGQTTKTAAEAWAINYLSSGQVVTRENVTFGTFARGFFAWDGAYLRTLRSRGRQTGVRHAANQQAYVDNYLIPEFGSLKLVRLDSERILDYALELQERGLSASTINHILTTLRTVLQYALRKKYIQVVPQIDTVGGVKAERGILCLEEVKAFFTLGWRDIRYYTINLIAATTGMRLGEILGLQRASVHNEYLEVKTSWERGVGLKGTKTGRARIIPIPERTAGALREAMTITPFTDPTDLVFTGRKRNAPLDHKMVQDSYAKALAAIGIDEDSRRERGLTFHSWRHFFNSLLINARIPVLKVQSLTGHSTDRMTENYFHADDFKDVLSILGGIG